MAPTRHNTVRLFILALAVGFVAVALTVLACGPAAPGGQQDGQAEPKATIPWLGTPPTESELATPAAQPTATPYPPGYVKPTEPPYVPPLTDAEVSATFTAELATEAAERPRGVAAPVNTPAPTPTALPVTEQVTQYARDKKYDVVAHVRAGSSRNLSLPAKFEWPWNTKPWDDLTRTKVLAITVYHGTLPDQYELITPQFIPWLAPTAGQEYVLFIEKTFAGENDLECSGVSLPGMRSPGRRCFTQRELDAMGGPGGFYLGEQAWIVEGGKAWQIPDKPSRPLRMDYDLIKAAQTEGAILSLSELETAIRAGLKK